MDSIKNILLDKQKEFYLKPQLFKIMRAIYGKNKLESHDFVQYIYCPQFYANKLCEDAYQNMRDGKGRKIIFSADPVELSDTEQDIYKYFEDKDEYFKKI